MMSRDESRPERRLPAPSRETAHAIGDVLEELLRQYRAKFPQLHLAVVRDTAQSR